MNGRLHTLNPLNVLKGEQLSSVVFVQDYLQLDFDGQCLTCYKWPVIQLKDHIYKINSPGYRDHLCMLISYPVAKAEIYERSMIVLKMGDPAASNLVIELLETDSEVATFRDLNGNWSVF